MKVIGYENTNRVYVGTLPTPSTTTPTPEQVTVPDKLKVLIDSLLIERPLWLFDLQLGYNYRVCGFKIMQDGECLCEVEYGYFTGRDFKFRITNDRIDAQRERGSGYCTDSTDRALAKIKKMVSKSTLSERLEKAQSMAATNLYRGWNRKQNEMRDKIAIRNSAATKYALGTGYEAFVEYAKNCDPTVYKAIIEHDETKAENLAVGDIKNMFDAGKTLIVLRYDSVYTVKSGDEIKTLTDAELPENVRRKMGMLKLVAKDTFISNAGYRVDEDVFVVTKDEV